jgi:hypothetical protein
VHYAARVAATLSPARYSSPGWYATSCPMVPTPCSSRDGRCDSRDSMACTHSSGLISPDRPQLADP